jgi:NAD-dependent deacetylase
LVTLEKYYEVTIITQNVDDLHERAGSSNVVHLHGELFKVRSTGDDSLVLDWRKDLCLGDNCKGGHQLRPHIVWFGEEVPLLPSAAASTREADIVLIIGTSMQVYPAAGLVHYAPPNAPIYFIDPRPSITESDYRNLTIIPERAAIGVPILTADLIDKAS